MGDQTKDRMEGQADEIKGRAKSAWGEMTDDERAKAEGKMDQMKGQAKQGMADIKDKADDAIKNVTDR